MSEHTWEFGHWGRSPSGSLFRFCGLRSDDDDVGTFVDRDSLPIQKCVRHMDYLPDCTGFDWKPIEPQEGYRILGRNEIVQLGDKYKADRHDKWFDATVFGDTVERLKASSTVAYARKLEPPEGYRLLRPKEKVRNWDMMRNSNGEWVEVLGDVRGVEHVPLPGRQYARKIEPQYRPFRDGDEFKPHRTRWWRYKAEADTGRTLTPQNYSDTKHGGLSWQERFDRCEFDDGQPFGVEAC